MHKAKVIEPNFLSWCSPVLLIPKKDGKMRFCIDFHKLNNAMIKDKYPLPWINDSLNMLWGAKWFSTLNLAAKYWQVKIREEDKAKTTFSVSGLNCSYWQCVHMSFGLFNTPATFQRMMDLILRGLKWTKVLVYIDDIIIFSPSFEQHIKDIKEILTCIEKADLHVKLSKCH